MTLRSTNPNSNRPWPAGLAPSENSVSEDEVGGRKTVSGEVGGIRVKDERSRYNNIFEFAYSINGQLTQILIASVAGHLMELEFEDRFSTLMFGTEEEESQ
ncbi:DNA topoisomerase, type IA, partial [Trema orientale]